MWACLLQLGSNMWNEQGNTRGREHRSNCDASPVLRFDKLLWDSYIDELKASGCNTVIIDIGEAMVFESHPELAVLGSWPQERMKKEVERLRAMGFEVVPKLNFSACHDVWLKDYSRMLSTPIYYQVCADVIHEVCEVFKPKYFHIGMDEENAQLQRRFDYAVCRQFDLWWHDLYYLVDCVEKENARAWVWSDYIWEHTDEFIAKMPHSVLQSNWYYSGKFDEDAKNGIGLRAFELLDKNGFDQVPTGSVWSSHQNFSMLTEYCKEQLADSPRFVGMMQTTWERLAGPWMHLHHIASEELVKSVSILNTK